MSDNHELVALEPELPKVDRMMSAIKKAWEDTANTCIRRAIELEAAAADLRDRADVLRRAVTLTTEVKTACVYERDASNRANALLLVNPGDKS